MHDRECVAFLQWALPRLRRPWSGFRKVRNQVCRRVERRVRALALADVAAYRAYLETHPEEWRALDALCPVTISCFYRDTAMWDALTAEVLPQLARRAVARTLHAASIGCACGEEPYTLALAWHFALAPRFPMLRLETTASDVVDPVLERARIGCYAASSLKLLPASWREHAFERVGEQWCLRTRFRDGVTFVRQDLRDALPDLQFDLILCRNLLFTYFDVPTQREVLARLLAHLRPGGALVIGRREVLPVEVTPLTPWPSIRPRGIFRHAT
jgi:chemotaxis protein methyltransferase CheR